jgi:hypothetical protein
MTRERWAWVLIAGAAVLLGVAVVELIRSASSDEAERAAVIKALETSARSDAPSGSGSAAGAPRFKTESPTEPLPADLREALEALSRALRREDRRAVRAALTALRSFVVLPSVPDEENGAALCRQAFDLMETLPLTPEEEVAKDKVLRGEPLTDEELALLIRWRRQNTPVLEMLREASRFPAIRFPVDIDAGFSAELEHIAHLIQASKRLQWDAAIAVLEGESDQAPMNAAVAFSLARAVRDDPFLVSQLVTAVVEGIALDMIREGNAMANPDLEAPFQAWGATIVQAGFARCLGAEVYAGIQTMMTMSPEELEALMVLGEPPERTEPLPPYSWADMAGYVDSMIRFIALAQQPYPQVAAQVPAIEAQLENSSGTVERLLMPAISRALDNMATAQSRAAMAQVIRQLEIYRQQFGGYPPDLSAFPGLPQDPISGRPFAYSPEGTGYVLLNQATKNEMHLEWRPGRGWIRPAPQPPPENP